jgi:RHS repeat-associated protein
VLSRFGYLRDPVGNPLAELRTGTLASVKVFGYDANDRLTSVCLQALCPDRRDPSIRYTYDPVGNRLSEATPKDTMNYSYNAADELTRAGSTSYGYDANGNQTRAGSDTFAYDLADRLVSVASGKTTTTYGYDGDGNRLTATTSDKKTVNTTRYVWDTVGGLPQLALERSGTGSLLQRYVYGIRRISLATPVGTSYYAYDSLGSVANVISSAGATQWTYAYEPFGTATTETKNDKKAPDNPMKFTGELNDPTGLYDLRARQYDPTSGRFLQQDPASADPAQPADGSYVYAGQLPTARIDPSGMQFRPSTEGVTYAMNSTIAGMGFGFPGFPDIWKELIKKLAECAIFHPVSCSKLAVPRGDAEQFLQRIGNWSPADRHAAVESFSGTITLQLVQRGQEFVRFYGGTAGQVGRFLTSWLWAGRFATPEDAKNGLWLWPYNNSAVYRQLVHAQEKVRALYGQIKGSTIQAYQWVIASTANYSFPPGEYRWWKRPPPQGPH